MVMKGAFITKVSNSATEEGNVSQKVEMVFKEVKIDYYMQDDATGALGAKNGQAGILKSTGSYGWDIPAGKVS